jgi:hypothetical protein
MVTVHRGRVLESEVHGMTHSAVDFENVDSTGTAEIAPSPHKRVVDRLDHRLVNLLTVVGFGLPLIGYFWFLSRFSVNVVFGDQWDDVTVIKGSYVHFFDWGPMWAQHFENRIFFPNIVVVLLAHTVHFNIEVEEYLGAVLLVVATVFILWAHKRRSPSTPWLYYCPVAILILSVVQYGNTIWGFQLAWYMVMLCLASAILLLDRMALTWVAFLGALAVAVVGSFSSLQGLLIWPTGLVLLYYRRRSLLLVVVWIAGAVASIVLYFHNYEFTVTPAREFARQHPLAAAKFFLFAIGDVVGKPVAIGTSTPDNSIVVLFGLVIVVLAVATVVICGVRRDTQGTSPVGVALICFGLLFAAVVTQGRSFLGYAGASFSRYTTFDLLILVGIYLALIGRRLPAVDINQVASSPSVRPPPDTGRRASRGAGGWRDRVALPGALLVVLVAMVVQIPFGIHNGVQGGRSLFTINVKSASVLRNIDHASNAEIEEYLYFLESPSSIREKARTLEQHRLSLFGNG